MPLSSSERSNAMKLRSAEADPHVIARDQILVAEATGVHSRCEHSTEVDGAFQNNHCWLTRSTPPRRTADYKALLH